MCSWLPDCIDNTSFPNRMKHAFLQQILPFGRYLLVSSCSCSKIRYCLIYMPQKGFSFRITLLIFVTEFHCIEFSKIMEFFQGKVMKGAVCQSIPMWPNPLINFMLDLSFINQIMDSKALVFSII